MTSDAPEPNTDTPGDARATYEEAARVLPHSARSAAAMLRLALQQLMPHIGGKGKNINQDIKRLVADDVPLEIQRSLDILRVVGNNAVHPGQIDVNDDPETAVALFTFFNLVVAHFFTQPREIKDAYEALPANLREAIEARDNGE